MSGRNAAKFLSLPWMFVYGCALLLIFGGLIQIYIVNVALDIHLHDTYFVIAHSYLVILIALFFALFACIYCLFPKVFKRYMNKIMGYIHFGLTLACICFILWPMHYNGITGMPRRYYDYSAWESFRQFSGMNYFISVVTVLLFAAQLLFVFNFITSIFTGKRAYGCLFI